MDLHPLTLKPLPYQSSLPQRSHSDIDLLVVHCTELPDLETARVYGERLLYPESGTGNSGHFYIDRDGALEQWVDPGRIAHHVRGFNPRSIGVELVNLGRYPHWFHSRHQQMTEHYPEAQLVALLALIAQLRTTFPQLRWIAGHADLDGEWLAAEDDDKIRIRRKLDPGPLFPWPLVLQQCGLEPYTELPCTAPASHSGSP
jgi:N-acetylmuramoyl-L-alanine amidase